MSFNPEYFYPTIITSITSLNGGVYGTVKATDVYPAVDVIDVAQSPAGTTKPYQVIQLFNYILGNFGFITYIPVLASATANLNATYDNGASGVGATLTNAGSFAAFTLDGQVGVLNARYLIQMQTAPAQNGIYTLTTVGDAVDKEWVLTRSIDFNQAANIFQNGIVYVPYGTTYGGTFWQDSFTGPITVGTTAINWTQWAFTSGTGIVNAGSINELAYYASAGTAVNGLPTANNSVLTTSAMGAPTWATVLPAVSLINATNLPIDAGTTGTLPLSRTSGILPLNQGGTNAALTASNGGIFYSNATAGAILSGTATAGLALLSGANTTPSWSNLPPITRVNVVVATTPGAGLYTPTAGMQYVIVSVQGGGGGSGGAATTDAVHVATAGGGGGGEYWEVLFTAAQIGASKAYVIGAGGTAGAAGNNFGGNGASTTFNTSWVIATGGTGGQGSASSAVAPVTSSVPNLGGVSGSFSTGTALKHNVGSPSGFGINLTVNNGYPGSGGNAGNGSAGGIAKVTASQPGTTGAQGSGASGAMTANGAQQAGAAGGDGYITFLEFISS